MTNRLNYLLSERGRAVSRTLDMTFVELLESEINLRPFSLGNQIILYINNVHLNNNGGGGSERNPGQTLVVSIPLRVLN